MNKELEANTQFSHYRIVSKIGAGGMGEVYLAEDTTLGRQVALKVLLSEVAGDEDRLRRFVHEAKAASALNHPNILTVYEIGSFENSRFIATELIKGETLRERLQGEPLTLRETLDATVQIASALNAAHSAGIVHRDIKPENVMLRDDGLVKVLDFGLAKLTEKKTETLDSEGETRAQVKTSPGMVMGTAAYMSPEQARGKTVDARSDIWSLGVVVYEMLTNQTPFAGETTNDTIAAILTREPAPLDENTPAELQRIVRKALQKKADERYQTVKDFLLDVKNLKRELEFAEELERSQMPHRAQASNVSVSQSAENATAILPAAKRTQNSLPQQTSSAEYIAGEVKKHKSGVALGSMILLALIGIGLWFFVLRPSNARQIESIAVLPFVNENGNADNEYLSDGMTESLITSLSQLPKLSVKARNSVFRYKGKDVNPQTVGNELNVQAVLLGRVIQRGEQLILNLELVDARTENVVWSERYARKQTDLVSLQNEIARDVSNKLKTKLTGADEQKLAKNYTENTEAYQLYLKGRYHWNKRTGADIRKSVEYFQQAIDNDPTYALAYAALAEAYILIPIYTTASPHDAFPKARAAATKALEIDETLAEAHTALGDILYEYDWKFAEAEREFKRAIELNPNYATAHHWYAEYLLAMGRDEEAIAEIKRAQELDPLSLIINSVVGMAYRDIRQYDKAIEQLKKTIEMDRNFAPAYESLAQTYEMKGMFEDAIPEFEKYLILNGASPEEAAREAKGLREAYRKSGANGYWRKRIEFFERWRVVQPDFLPQLSFVASFYAQLGEKDQALAFYEKAYEERRSDAIRLKSPFHDPIRTEPRFQDLMRRIGLPQ